MRTPQDVAPRAPKTRGRARWWILAAVLILIVLVVSLRSLATIYTDSLWFSSVHLHSVWSTLLAVKVGLFASFGAIFFVVLWVNLLVCDRLASAEPTTEPDDELVRRYQQAVRPYAGRVYALLAFVFALVAASGTVGEWQNWILFTHAQSFPATDPQFHKNVGFYVFKLPFYSFLVNWALVSLVVILVVTVIFHYLNGGIRAQRVSPRVRPAVKVHISVLLAAIALVKAAGYLVQRWHLMTSTNGVVEGPGYTDVHARLPALELLFFISLFAAAILLWNIRRRGWTLPVLAIGIWAFVALVIGVIYPAVLQLVKVNPAQSTLEEPYIARNIAATRTAYGINDVQSSPFEGNTSVPKAAVAANETTINNIRIWDPDPSLSLVDFQKRQELKGYYTFQSVGVDRYTINGQLTPAVVGVRQVDTSSLAASSWVLTHLEYTHGQGLALAMANRSTSDGFPVYGIQNVPSQSDPGLPDVTQTDVYFGLNDPGYVVANTKQAELDYQLPDGANRFTHYKGTGGVALNNFFTRAAFALRLGSFDVLVSNLITPQSRIMFVRDVQEMAQKAAPFLSFDADPYAAVVNGHIDWILDGYTTTDQYPYSQNANTQQVPPGSGLPGSYNYVRNSVKVVIDSYSGKMTYYAMDPKDPILRAYMSAFPGMFKPASQMSTQLRDHLRYPEDIFSIQAAIFGRYHITSPEDFYTAAYAWNLSPTAGVGSPDNALTVTITTNAQGQPVQGNLVRMSPVYQVLQQPGEASQGQEFTITDVFVPAGNSQGSNNSQNLMSAFIVGDANPGHYGELHVYKTPVSSSVTGPALADSEIQSDKTVSHETTLLGSNGSHVVLGNILPVPIDNAMIYVRPMYVESTGNPTPQLTYVIAVLGQKVKIDTSLQAVLSDILGTNTSSPSSSPSSGTKTAGQTQAEQYLQQAQNDYNMALQALAASNLTAYAQDIQNMETAVKNAQQALQSSSGPSTGTTTTTTQKPATTTTTGKPPASTTTTTTQKASATAASRRRTGTR